MANAKIISFVDHQINAVVDAAFDAMAVELDDLGIELREDVRKAIEYSTNMIIYDHQADTRLLQRAIQQLREDVDRLQEGGGNPPL